VIFFVFTNVSVSKHNKKQTLELSSPSKEERKLFVDPLMFAMNPMMNPMAMHFPLNSDKKYTVKHNLHVVHGPYGMNPYMMGGMMGMMGGMMNPYMMGGMMNPYMMGGMMHGMMGGMMHGMMGGMMNPYMMGMMGGMMNPYMMGMMNPYMMGGMMGYHPMNVYHPMHPFNPMNMYGASFMHPGAAAQHPEEHEESHEEDDEEDRKLLETSNLTEEDKLAQKLYDQMIEEKLDAEKGGIKVDF
jgi:hypothetical protein